MVKLFGIKNCSTVKKALNWLDENLIEYSFVDVKKNISKEDLSYWFNNLPEGLIPLSFVNQKGLTWRKLSPDLKEYIKSKDGIINLILQYPSVMKRPVLTKDNNVKILGYDESFFLSKTLSRSNRPPFFFAHHSDDLSIK